MYKDQDEEKQQKQGMLQPEKPTNYNDIQIDTPSQKGLKVYLMIYDLTRFNCCLGCCGFGVYHAGLQVGQKEYSGTESGLICIEPKSYQGCYRFKEALYMGEANISTEEELKMRIDTLKEDYPMSGSEYHLFKNNCQQFCDRLCQVLNVKRVPYATTRISRCFGKCDCCCPRSVILGIVE